MKSLLVEALLQANSGGKGQTLTDSGSYDTTDRELPITANDAVAERSDATQGAASSRLPDDARELSLEEAEVEVIETRNEQNVLAPGGSLAADLTGKGPTLARFTPHACIMLAVVTAGFWLGYQHLRLAYSEAGLGASQLRASGAQAAEASIAPNHSAAGRFPFLAGRVDTDAAEDLE